MGDELANNRQQLKEGDPNFYSIHYSELTRQITNYHPMTQTVLEVRQQYCEDELRISAVNTPDILRKFEEIEAIKKFILEQHGSLEQNS